MFTAHSVCHTPKGAHHLDDEGENEGDDHFYVCQNMVGQNTVGQEMAIRQLLQVTYLAQCYDNVPS